MSSSNAGDFYIEAHFQAQQCPPGRVRCQKPSFEPLNNGGPWHNSLNEDEVDDFFEPDQSVIMSEDDKAHDRPYSMNPSAAATSI